MTWFSTPHYQSNKGFQVHEHYGMKQFQLWKKGAQLCRNVYHWHVFQCFDYRQVRKKDSSSSFWNWTRNTRSSATNSKQTWTHWWPKRSLKCAHVRTPSMSCHQLTLHKWNSGNIKPFLLWEKFPLAQKDEVQVSFKQTTCNANSKMKERQLRYSVFTAINAHGSLGICLKFIIDLLTGIPVWTTRITSMFEAVTGGENGWGSTK